MSTLGSCSIRQSQNTSMLSSLFTLPSARLVFFTGNKVMLPFSKQPLKCLRIAFWSKKNVNVYLPSEAILYSYLSFGCTFQLSVYCQVGDRRLSISEVHVSIYQTVMVLHFMLAIMFIIKNTTIANGSIKQRLMSQSSTWRKWSLVGRLPIAICNTLYPTYDVDQSTASVYTCGIVLWLGKYHDIALWYN